MAYRRNYRSARRSAPRRKFVWARKSGTAVIAGPGSDPFGYNVDALDDFKALYGADLLGATLVRVRGQILTHLPDMAPEEIGEIVVGMRTYTEGPDGGVVGEETPHLQPYADWLMFQPSIIAHGTGPTDSFNVYAGHRYDVDIKSSRKFEELGDGLLLSASHNISGIAGYMSYNLSFGLKLA